MIDTLMVLWTKGISTRILRIALSFSLLLGGIVLLLFLITTSNVKWPGLAFTATNPNITNASAKDSMLPAPVSTTGSEVNIIPIILHNPTPATNQVSTASSSMSAAVHSSYRHRIHFTQYQTPHQAGGEPGGVPRLNLRLTTGSPMPSLQTAGCQAYCSILFPVNRWR